MTHHTPLPFRPLPAPPKPFAGAAAAFWAPSNTLTADYLYLAGALLVVMALLLILRRRGHRQDALDVPPLQKAPFIQALLEVAADRRSRMDIVCAQPGNTLTPLHGICLHQENKEIVRILLQDAAVPSAWKSAPVNVFFNIATRSSRTFYHFSGKVLDICPQGRSWTLDLPRPAALTNNQRREFVRITPGPGMVEALTLWPFPPSQALPETAAALGRPDFAFRPPKMAQMALMDISAGGVRVRLAGQRLNELQKTHTVGDRYILLLMVDALKDGGSQMFWLCGLSRRTHTPENSQHLELGVQFTHWCAPPALAAPIAWHAVEPDGEAPPLLRWTGRANVLLGRHLEAAAAPSVTSH